MTPLIRCQINHYYLRVYSFNHCASEIRIIIHGGGVNAPTVVARVMSALAVNNALTMARSPFAEAWLSAVAPFYRRRL